MNIFFLHANPRRAAQAHCDRHVVKMILESAQLLWTAHHATKSPIPADAPTPYKSLNPNHPCGRWTRASVINYLWLCALATCLIDEYHYRYPHGRAHACEPHIAWLTANPPSLPWIRMTQPALAMPPEYHVVGDPVASYRAYYLGPKRDRGLLIYTRREVPDWVGSHPSPAKVGSHPSPAKDSGQAPTPKTRSTQ
jgi:hypothetical protein